MDEDALRRWHKAVQRARESLGEGTEGDPEPLRQLVAELERVQQALRRISGGAVSRTRLADAVRDALRTLLTTEGPELIPEVRELAARLETLQQNVETAPAAVTEIRQELARSVQSVRDDLSREITQSADGMVATLNQKVDDIKSMIGSLPVLMPTRRFQENLLDRLRHVENELEGALERAVGELHRHVNQLENRVAARPPEIAAWQERLRGLEERSSALSGEVARLQESLSEFRLEVRELMARQLERTAARSGGNEQWALVRRLVLDVRDLLRDQAAEAMEARPPGRHRGLWARLGPGRQEDAPVSEEARGQRRLRLESVLEELESFLVRPPREPPTE